MSEGPAVATARAGQRPPTERGGSGAGTVPLWSWPCGIPLACLGLTLTSGVVLGLKATRPDLSIDWLPIQILRPLHTLTVLGMVWSGLGALFVCLADRSACAGGAALRSRTTWLMGAFLILATASIVTGFGSGKEYVSWPPVLSALPVAAFVLLLLAWITNARILVTRSPEAAWLIGLGLACIPLGLIEASGVRLAAPGFARELTFDWQALDIVFAGGTAALYGFGIVMAGEATKPLRAPWLYVLAAFAFVSTFGRHHYLSPQSGVPKLIALAASLLAAVSFVRHVRVRSQLRQRAGGGLVAPFLRAAELWTLVAIGSGLLLATPQINLVLHGTHAIVGHAMGAMIGVHCMLVLAGVAWLTGSEDESTGGAITRPVRWLNAILALVCLDLLVAGAVKGLMRLEWIHAEYQPLIRALLIPLPVLGLALVLAIGRIVWVLHAAARDRARLGLRRPG